MAEQAAEPTGAAPRAESPEHTNLRLRRHLRDSNALLGLPAIWRGQNLEQIAHSFLDVLVSLLRVDLAHLRLDTRASSRAPSERETEFWHPRCPASPEIVTQPFLELAPPQPLPVVSIPHPFQDGTLRVVGMRAELIDEGALIVVGSARAGFPTRDEQFLLRAAVDQATVAIANARLFEQAQQAIRLRDEFFSVAAHELRTPMTSLRAAVQLLQRHAGRGEPLPAALVDRHIKTVDEQSKKMVQLIVQLLDVSRMETGKLSLELQRTNLWQLVWSVVANLQATTDQHQLEVAPAAPARPLMATVDPLRLEQVLVNLIDNAMKYSPEGGSIAVGINVHDPETVQITVRDHGLGIPPERRERIFDRFFQAHLETHRSGMGLGLYISREIVRQHGGDLTAEFPADGGSCFVISLPMHQHDERPSSD
jgi:signal transduction histidine kinase